MLLKVRKLRDDALMPAKANVADIGWDLFVLNKYRINAHIAYHIRTGIAIEPPDGYYAMITGRSSTLDRGILVYLGIIDPEYRGELLLNVYAFRDNVQINQYDRLAQLVLVPIAQGIDTVEVAELAKSARGERGFGSTGV